MRGEMSTVQFSLKDDFNRFCNDFREHNVQIRGKDERDLTVTISDLTERDIEIVRRYNGRVMP